MPRKRCVDAGEHDAERSHALSQLLERAVRECRDQQRAHRDRSEIDHAQHEDENRVERLLDDWCEHISAAMGALLDGEHGHGEGDGEDDQREQVRLPSAAVDDLDDIVGDD